MTATPWKTLDGSPPRIIAHRGASGQRPEHSPQAYALAFAQGADAVEPDVLPSRDGVLFVRHDIDLASTTDIARHPEFAARARSVGGKPQWWIGDFDAAELDSLSCVQPNPLRSREFDGRSGILRLSTLLEMARAASCTVDVEIKDPEYFRTLGYDPVRLVETELRDKRLLGEDAPLWLECSDHTVLRELHARCGNRCFALLDGLPDAAELRALSEWATGVAPHKSLLWDARGADTGFVMQAHARGLDVHAWTMRDDGGYAPFDSPAEELAAAFALGADALFCDFPETALAARDLSAKP
ncbi:MAG TPA: glycerophosphodiester phosphodiesterase family protein [Rudaea sp.]|nr:glycerophosphodiester phosphodiesterase family protein [Rudaea sp.]